jgi:hypothetical protein
MLIVAGNVVLETLSHASVQEASSTVSCSVLGFTGSGGFSLQEEQESIAATKRIKIENCSRIMSGPVEG